MRKEILWESETASKAEVDRMEVEFIRSLRSNDARVGYNRRPRFKEATAAPTEPATEGADPSPRGR